MDAKAKRPLWQKLAMATAVLLAALLVWLVALGRVAGAAEAADYTSSVTWGEPVITTYPPTSWQSINNYQELYNSLVATRAYTTSVDESAVEPVAHAATASCRYFKRIRNKHTIKNVFGAWVWKLTMRTSWCFNGRNVQKIYPADLRWEISQWAYTAGMRWKGPYKRAANCYDYNGYTNHNCLWKYEWVNILTAPLIGQGEAAPEHHCLGTRVYGNGDHRRNFKC